MDAVERMRPYASRVGLAIDWALPEGEDIWVQADTRRIGQVLSNLLSNAVKFTPPGGRIEAGLRHAHEAVEIWVADTGVGIASDQLARVFERFYKVDPSRSSSGTGLGLAICKHIVRAHGGKIWATSAGLGRGATFTFTLQVADLASARTRDPVLTIAGSRREV
jgi:two-component system phosphate regulon sensor histidine kinase PhoR